jgi:hypothetical protein
MKQNVSIHTDSGSISVNVSTATAKVLLIGLGATLIIAGVLMSSEKQAK